MLFPKVSSERGLAFYFKQAKDGSGKTRREKRKAVLSKAMERTAEKQVVWEQK